MNGEGSDASESANDEDVPAGTNSATIREEDGLCPFVKQADKRLGPK